jgi:hypothetical protein
MEKGYAQYLLCFFASGVLLAFKGHVGAALISMSVVLVGLHLTNDSRKR